MPQLARHAHSYINFSPELTRSREGWLLKRDLLSASEFIESAIVDGREAEAIDAARRIVGFETNATPLVRRQAGLLLSRNGQCDGSQDDVPNSSPTAAGVWRKRTRLNLRDSLAWVELALSQVIGGYNKAAQRSIIVALQIDPDNRHVLRSAARFFVHIEDPQQAHDIMLRSAATRHDPWLLAAELAISGLANRSPAYAKQGIRLIEDGGLIPRQITELAGAVGTLELMSGNRRKARKRFELSMVDPTGNALAQGEWASTSFGTDIVTRHGFENVVDKMEAVTIHHFRGGNLERMPKACEDWLLEEPYLVKPYIIGALIAGVLDDHETALRLANQGIRLHPGDPCLLNALAFSLASSGQPIKAHKAISLLKLDDLDPNIVGIAHANLGLIAFRKNDIELGKDYYTRAINGFRARGAVAQEASARVYFAREATLAKLPESTYLLDEAKRAVAKGPLPDVTFALGRVEALIRGN